jgi:hypothetical protein
MRDGVCLRCAGLGIIRAAQVRFTVNWADDRLSVRAFDAPLSDIVAEVARLTGLKVVRKAATEMLAEFARLAREKEREAAAIALIRGSTLPHRTSTKPLTIAHHHNIHQKFPRIR